MTPTLKRKTRCAVYCRKSSEEGLEQEFNSLDAQRDAGLAYIESQRHEGWIAIADRYEDGGFSGGNLERPALKHLLADIEGGRVDVVVVYKIDRLSRALMDFAKLVEVFDRRGVTFVSVTQSFNTTTSMGRLTLNILLSFAQFEREVKAGHHHRYCAQGGSKQVHHGSLYWVKGSVSFADEARIVTVVNVELPNEATISSHRGPSTTANRISFIMSFPRELSTGRSVARSIPDIEKPLQCAKCDLATSIAIEGEMSLLDKIEEVIVPSIHLDNAPTADKGSRKSRNSCHHTGSAYSLGNCTRL